MKNIVVNKVKNIEYTNIEEYKKSIDQNITQLGKLDQGRIEILKTLETAVEKEFYYNGKKRNYILRNDTNKRVHVGIKINTGNSKELVKEIIEI